MKLPIIESARAVRESPELQDASIIPMRHGVAEEARAMDVDGSPRARLMSWMKSGRAA